MRTAHGLERSAFAKALGHFGWVSGNGLVGWGIMVLCLTIGSGLLDVAVGAICGASIVGGAWLDWSRTIRKPRGNYARRAEIANKISMHLRLAVAGDVWTLTVEDMNVILEALREKRGADV